eukprot:CAMPEP_0174967044 /NCGR_PEP_ID=MMETSP0004_2-20121128/7369_1 /TAXON_ID=420556 /ORGANISM="Ochromonas sp., Strain CCMP1393" /LENGTH=642 /DNA_ID=CAMNT_0016216141 /DNA_START=55 /DNA_END=1983 /DNA_ORIENTATION=+
MSDLSRLLTANYAAGMQFDSGNEEDGFGDAHDDQHMKRRKLSEDERLQRCRERNRIHARNTRERKRAQMDLLQQRIQELSDEKQSLENFEPESSVASILVSLSTTPQLETKAAGMSNFPFSDRNGSVAGDESSKNFASDTVERLKSKISANLSDDEELEMDADILLKDKSGCSTSELEMIRRERNRMHAKKTRLRKKRMLTEMEAIIYGLEEDIRKLRQQHNMVGDECSLLGYQDLRKPPGAGIGGGGASVVTHSSSSGSSSVLGNSKFTGFRHANRADSIHGSSSSSNLSTMGGGGRSSAAISSSSSSSSCGNSVGGGTVNSGISNSSSNSGSHSSSSGSKSRKRGTDSLAASSSSFIAAAAAGGAGLSKGGTGRGYYDKQGQEFVQQHAKALAAMLAAAGTGTFGPTAAAALHGNASAAALAGNEGPYRSTLDFYNDLYRGATTTMPHAFSNIGHMDAATNAAAAAAMYGGISSSNGSLSGLVNCAGALSALATSTSETVAEAGGTATTTTTTAPTAGGGGSGGNDYDERAQVEVKSSDASAGEREELLEEDKEVADSMNSSTSIGNTTSSSSASDSHSYNSAPAAAGGGGGEGGDRSCSSSSTNSTMDVSKEEQDPDQDPDPDHNDGSAESVSSHSSHD